MSYLINIFLKGLKVSLYCFGSKTDKLQANLSYQEEQIINLCSAFLSLGKLNRKFHYHFNYHCSIWRYIQKFPVVTNLFILIYFSYKCWPQSSTVSCWCTAGALHSLCRSSCVCKNHVHSSHWIVAFTKLCSTTNVIGMKGGCTRKIHDRLHS